MRSHVGQFNRVAIGICAHRTDRAGGAARPHHVLDDELLAERARHVLAENASNDVGGPARGERHDDGDRPRWISLRRCRARAGYCQGERADRGSNGLSYHHGLFLPASFRAVLLLPRLSRDSSEPPWVRGKPENIRSAAGLALLISALGTQICRALGSV